MTYLYKSLRFGICANNPAIWTAAKLLTVRPRKMLLSLLYGSEFKMKFAALLPMPLYGWIHLTLLLYSQIKPQNLLHANPSRSTALNSAVRPTRAAVLPAAIFCCLILLLYGFITRVIKLLASS